MQEHAGMSMVKEVPIIFLNLEKRNRVKKHPKIANKRFSNY